MKPVIYSFTDFKPDQVARLRASAPNYDFILAQDSPLIPTERLIGVIGWKRALNQTLLSAPDLRWIQTISAGVDYLPWPEIDRRKILVSNGSGIHAQVITEHVLGIILGYERGLFGYQRAQREHQWLTNQFEPDDVAGKKLLIFGAGHIGRQLARQATALGLHVSGVNTRGEQQTDFEQMYTLTTVKKALVDFDIIVNILPLTPATTGYFNAAFFADLGSQAVFINVGRGRSVVTTDLVAALKRHQFSFAAADVFEQEPLTKDSPLWDVPNLMITPHVAGQVPHFRQKLFAIVQPNLAQFASKGTLLINQVDPQRGY
ncbi:NAD(P)-dependent oxidoreductase [Lapidilactobacillus luobeiensis]|uniref:NAD(P)-dependent oxidoreductase n=1 Tax=Lapidilactobacillus luobeiensis TaxID=2950371 RepID=UPI0021C41419|nr:NAD(P)-dependent oxidoreductase [Lapidilactobacillus luobeiensis]